MQNDLFQLFGMGFSVRDLVLILGGLFLLVKGTMEIRELIAGGHDEDPNTTKASGVVRHGDRCRSRSSTSCSRWIR